MKANLLKEVAAELASTTAGTAADRLRELQAGGLVEKGSPGRYGGVVISNSGRVNALLGFVFDPLNGESRVAMVKRIRRLKLSAAVYNPRRSPLEFKDSAVAALQFVEGLGINFASDLGTVLDGLVGSFRTSSFATWEAGSQADITVEFNGERSATVMIDRPHVNVAVVFIFETKKSAPPSPVERITRLHRTVFERLAANETAPDQG